MNLFAIAGSILIFPLLVQIILGSIIIFKRIKWNFDLVCVINIVGQIFSIYIALKIITIDAEKQNVRCGMPQASMFFLGIISAIVLVITIGIQIGIIKYKNRKKTK